MKKPITPQCELASRVEELRGYPTKTLLAYIAAMLERKKSDIAEPLAGPQAPTRQGTCESRLTHAHQIMLAAARLYLEEQSEVFSREDIRDRLGLTQAEWMAGYTAIFQGMRADQPGGAPSVPAELRGVFRQVAHGRHTLTGNGLELARTLLAQD